MFLVTVLTPQAKLLRRVFLCLEDAESYCDYCYNCGLTIWELDRVDTTLSDMFELCGGQSPTS